MPKPVSQTPPLASIYQDVRRLDVLMNESARVRLAQRPRERDPDAQKLRYSQRPAEQSIEDRTPGVLEYQRHAVAVAGKLEWLCRPGGIKVGSEGVFMFEPREARERSFSAATSRIGGSPSPVPRYSVKSPSRNCENA